MTDRDQEHGCTCPGKTGGATHLGDPLTVEQIKELSDKAEVVITWSGGNGPHPYRVLVDKYGIRCVEGAYVDPILSFQDQRNPNHRVTLGWDEKTIEFYDLKNDRSTAGEREEWARLRGEVIS